MKEYTLDEVKKAWASGYQAHTQAEINRRVQGFAALVRGIAATGAVAPDEFGRRIGLNAKEAAEVFSAFESTEYSRSRISAYKVLITTIGFMEQLSFFVGRMTLLQPSNRSFFPSKFFSG